MYETKYGMPQTKEQMEIFNEDPIGWMKRHIEANLPNDDISKAVFQMTSAHGIKHNSNKFYIILAFMALMTNEHLVRDFEIYRQNNPNPNFYSKLNKLQNRSDHTCPDLNLS